MRLSVASNSNLVRPGGACEICGAPIDRRARYCRQHSQRHLTKEHQRAAADQRWSQSGGGDMTVIQAAPIRAYEGPSWLVEMAGPWRKGLRAVGRDEQVKVLDRNIVGWGSANAIIEVTNRDGWRRHMLAELRESAMILADDTCQTCQDLGLEVDTKYSHYHSDTPAVPPPAPLNLPDTLLTEEEAIALLGEEAIFVAGSINPDTATAKAIGDIVRIDGSITASTGSDRPLLITVYFDTPIARWEDEEDEKPWTLAGYRVEPA